MTEWVTIKVPEEVRDKAKGDPRPYHEILEAGLEWGNLAPAQLLDKVESMAEDDDTALEFSDVLTVVSNNHSREWINDRIVDGEDETQDTPSEVIERLERIETAQGGTVSDALELADGGMNELLEEIRKAVELAEQARDNTDQIKRRMQ